MSIDGVTLRPSMKIIVAADVVATAIAIAGAWAIYHYFTSGPAWLPALPFIVLLAPLRMHLRRLAVTLRFHDDHLTLETGMLSRVRRTVDMAKIQDVTVRQTLGQRLLNVGDLMLESAGESGAMSIRNLDRPRAIADAILASSRKSPHTGLP
jgi:uncharacterized membrane protein YdbT with pleckstrin-like domain